MAITQSNNFLPFVSCFMQSRISNREIPILKLLKNRNRAIICGKTTVTFHRLFCRAIIMSLFKVRVFILSILAAKWSCTKGPFIFEFLLRYTNFVFFYSCNLDCCQIYEQFLCEKTLLRDVKKSGKYD